MNAPLMHSLFELDQAQSEMQYLQPSACKPVEHKSNNSKDFIMFKEVDWFQGEQTKPFRIPQAWWITKEVNNVHAPEI